MATNLDRYKADLEKLVALADALTDACNLKAHPEEFSKAAAKKFGKEKAVAFLASLPDFDATYEKWYSESITVVRQLLPDRLKNFVGLYERPTNRKVLLYDNYTVRDLIEGLRRNDGAVTMEAGVVKFMQQVAILRACEARFESSLFEIRQLVQADLFDSEIEAARELLKHGFLRAAGAIAGVVLEKHLQQVADDHGVTIAKKHPGISDLNEALKASSVITIPQWRHITLLGDIRNLCDHKKQQEPTKDQVTDLIDGADKVLKTIA